MLRLCPLAAHALRLAGAALLSPGSCTFEDSACGYQWDYAHLPWTLHGEGHEKPQREPPATLQGKRESLFSDSNFYTSPKVTVDWRVNGPPLRRHWTKH